MDVNGNLNYSVRNTQLLVCLSRKLASEGYGANSQHVQLFGCLKVNLIKHCKLIQRACRVLSFLGLCTFLSIGSSVGILSYLLAQDRINSIILYLTWQMERVDCHFTHPNSAFWQEDCCMLYSSVTVTDAAMSCYWPCPIIATQSRKFSLFTVSRIFVF